MMKIDELKEWIEIRKQNYMDKRLPRVFQLQDEINIMLGLDTNIYDGKGIRTMDLGREELLKLTLEIKKLKDSQNKTQEKNGNNK